MTNSPIRAINFIRNFIISMHRCMSELMNLHFYDSVMIIFCIICKLIQVMK